MHPAGDELDYEALEAEWYGPDPSRWDDDPSPYAGTYSEE
jgi:hypothetical protein